MAQRQTAGTLPAEYAGRVLHMIAKLLALIGGIIVGAMAVLTTASVLARTFLGYPIPGDYELVGIMNGVAVFAFLPYCQITLSNIMVDFFINKASARAKSLCDAIGSLLYLSLACLLTWRLIYGAIDMYKYYEQTATLSIPRWITFPFDIACMAVLIAVTGYTLIQASCKALNPDSLNDEGRG